MNDYVFEGKLEVYCGPMKSGKTKFLLARLDTLNYVKGISMILIKPKIDNRDQGFKSRCSSTTDQKCILIDENNPKSIYNHIGEKTNIIFIDEIQFFSQEIVNVIKDLLKQKKHIIVSGLDMDFRGEPFGCVPTILSIASRIHKLQGVCEVEGCNRAATHTQRLINGKPSKFDEPTIIIGDKEEGYECRCILHHECVK